MTTAYWAEARGNPIHAARGADVVASAGNPGGNMEGKEVRFGIANSALYATVTTDASCGAVNAMHDSFTPIGGLVPLVNIQLGEVVFGGVGAGLYGMLVMVVLTVFIAGLMVGRTPEYLGKKIRAREVQAAMLYVLIFPTVILTLTAVSVLLPAGLKGLNNAGPHGLSEILYAFTSTPGNNGSAFAGLTGTTYYYNTLFGVATLIGRFAMIVPMLALGGFLAEQQPGAGDGGHLPGHHAAVRRAADRRHPDRGRAHLLPGALARTDRRAFPDAGREALLTWPSARAPCSIRRSSGAPCTRRCTSWSRATCSGIR